GEGAAYMTSAVPGTAAARRTLMANGQETRARRSNASRSTGSNGSGNGSATERGSEAQAKRHAQEAKRKVDKRREKLSGAAGWVADRAGQWSLDGPDTAFMERQKYFWNPLIDYW